MFKVKKERCEQCLFSKNKIVSNERRKQILAECDRNDSHFICHKSSFKGENTCCKGFYDTKSSQLIRVAQRLHMVKFEE